MKTLTEEQIKQELEDHHRKLITSFLQHNFKYIVKNKLGPTEAISCAFNLYMNLIRAINFDSEGFCKLRRIIDNALDELENQQQEEEDNGL